jgi:hypothetical protein
MFIQRLLGPFVNDTYLFLVALHQTIPFHSIPFAKNWRRRYQKLEFTEPMTRMRKNADICNLFATRRTHCFMVGLLK